MTIDIRPQCDANGPAPAKKIVLVSGATGFVGTHVVLEFVREGWFVHATAQSQEEADEWLAMHHSVAHSVQFFIVPDMVLPGSWDKAIQGVQAVAHVASPYFFAYQDVQKEMLQPAITGTLSILEAAAQTTSVKRVVITSSFAAMLNLKAWPEVGKTYDESDWNPSTEEEAVLEANGGNKVFAYCASKKLAEQAAWRFMKQHSPHFTLAAICPAMIYGPPIHVTSIDRLNTSSLDIWQLINGANEFAPATFVPVGVDVRDVARAHCLSIALDIAAGQRYLLTGFHFTFDQACDVLRRAYPAQQHRIARARSLEVFEHYETDISKSLEELGLVYTSFEKCIRDAAAQLWQIEARHRTV